MEEEKEEGGRLERVGVVCQCLEMLEMPQC